MANIICITCPKGCHLTVDEKPWKSAAIPANAAWNTVETN